MAKTDTITHESPQKGHFPPWSPLVAGIVVVGAYFGASILGQLSLAAYAWLRHWDSATFQKWYDSSTYAQFALNGLIYVIMAAAVYAFARMYKVPLRAFGLVRPRLRDVGVMLLGVPVYVAGYFVLSVVAKVIFPAINLNQQQQLGFQAVHQPLALAAIFFSLVILPPLVEEFLMRGFLFTSLLRRVSFVPAAIITSAVFASAHLQVGSGAPPLWIAAIDTFMLSLVLCYMRFKTGSLWPGILLHALKNGVAFVSIFILHIT